MKIDFIMFQVDIRMPPTPPTTDPEFAGAIPGEEEGEREEGQEEEDDGSTIAGNAPVITVAGGQSEGENQDSPTAGMMDAGGTETTPTAPVTPGPCLLRTPTTPWEMPIPSHLLARRAAEEVNMFLI